MENQPVIYINGDTAKSMDKSFQGKPVVVMHTDEPDLSRVHTDFDGMVIRSFYNKADGNHWAEFVVYTDDGLEKIASGWKLSNAYGITQERGRGTWHGVDYDTEVASAEYEHLAIVPNPRYQDSIVLTPEQFKAYNEEKEDELLRIANSKGENKMFKLFKKEAVKNSDELTSMSVMLPKSKIEKTITQLVNEADSAEEKKGKPVLVNSTDLIEIDGKKITIADFLKVHNELKEEMENMDEDPENMEDDPENMEDDPENMDDDPENMDDDPENMEDDPENMDDDPENMGKKGKKKKKNSMTLREAKEAHEKSLRRFNKLKNAHNRAPSKSTNIDLGEDKLKRGTSRYGS